MDNLNVFFKLYEIKPIYFNNWPPTKTDDHTIHYTRIQSESIDDTFFSTLSTIWKCIKCWMKLMKSCFELYELIRMSQVRMVLLNTIKLKQNIINNKYK